jgi:hypothetical protein
MKIGYVAEGNGRQIYESGDNSILWLPSNPDELLEAEALAAN